MTRNMPFACSICEEESTRICIECTKDTCGNHLCEKCLCCSDCCQCDLKLETEHQWRMPTVRDPEPMPHPHPMPDPDPAPEPDPIPMVPRREQDN
jgi:hypothetical protein